MKISDILTEEEMKKIKGPFAPIYKPLGDKPDMKMEESEEGSDEDNESNS